MPPEQMSIRLQLSPDFFRMVIAVSILFAICFWVSGIVSVAKP